MTIKLDTFVEILEQDTGYPDRNADLTWTLIVGSFDEYDAYLDSDLSVTETSEAKQLFINYCRDLNSVVIDIEGG